ncbi:MAG: 16S rRNA (guanine(527)-N(7))-methyltransferase RsmG [Rhizobiales bacterium 65-79]|nr:16S rRNA (guanine(527)-N(7))-methyltransferase RsmG [Hyphomicrobiales bacterium]OJU04697.1 MAG: 16S rRNA (guanine(527)-N(7))-methyltransferase RsmG [Rhizobiales bacterium 65-79]
MSEERIASLREVAGDVSRETAERLTEFEARVRHWSTRINLAAPSQLDQLWRRHILDSAQLVRFASETRWLDLGSGGGFPGAVVAILLRDRPEFHIDLVESNRKKAAFLKTALVACPCARVHPMRIEEAYPIVKSTQIVTARALAPLSDLLRLAAPWLTSGARGLFHKGRDYASEIQQARDAWRFDLIEHRSMVDREGMILEISNLGVR